MSRDVGKERRIVPTRGRSAPAWAIGNVRAPRITCRGAHVDVGQRHTKLVHGPGQFSSPLAGAGQTKLFDFVVVEFGFAKYSICEFVRATEEGP